MPFEANNSELLMSMIYQININKLYQSIHNDIKIATRVHRVIAQMPPITLKLEYDFW
jgi:hypothetical protein